MIVELVAQKIGEKATDSIVVELLNPTEMEDGIYYSAQLTPFGIDAIVHIKIIPDKEANT